MIVFIDIETDGLLFDLTRTWVVVCKTSTDILTFYPHDNEEDVQALNDLLSEATTIVGHNIMMFDLPVLNKLYGISYDYNKIFDTLIVSRLLKPDRESGHSLKEWGIKLKLFKGDHKDFTKYSTEMLDYCINDVNVTEVLYDYLTTKELPIYQPKITRAVKLEHDFAYIIQKQINAGFTLDVDKCTKLYIELESEYSSLYNDIKSLMPKLKDDTHYLKIKKEGKLFSESETSYSYYRTKDKLVVKEFKFEDPNPTSRKQIIDLFIGKYDWKPKHFTENMSPNIDEKVLSSLSYPEAIKLSRLFRLQKQMGMIKNKNGGWLNYVKDNNRVHGMVHTNSTNTGRCSHSLPNLAQVDKKDLRMREVWVPQPGWKLVGVDASGLELRMMGHYLAIYDKGAFGHEVIQGDIHTLNQKSSGLLTRNAAKTLIYALIYGGGDIKLGTIYATDHNLSGLSEAKLEHLGSQVREKLFTNLIGYKEILKTLKQVLIHRKYLIGLDGRPLFPRKVYSAFNLLLQSAGAIVMKQALITMFNYFTRHGYKHGIDYNYVANVHDEVQFECRPDIADELSKLAVQSIRDVKQELNLNIDLDGEAKIGNNWSQTH